VERCPQQALYHHRALAFLLLVPLAATSFKYWMKRLGKNWKRLHKLIYLIVPLAGIPLFTGGKGQPAPPAGQPVPALLYGSIILVLLILRISRVRLR